MKEFEYDKKAEIVPRILGGLTVPVGIGVFFIWIVTIPIPFYPEFRFMKILYVFAFDAAIYAAANFVDVKNHGMANIVKKLFSKSIVAVKIKRVNFIGKNDDSTREGH